MSRFKTNLENIHAQLQDIGSELDSQIGRLEGEAPEYMKFDGLWDAQKDLKERVEELRKWMEKFDIGSIDVSTL